jgi:hypothetical protein
MLVITTLEMSLSGNPTYASVDGFILIMVQNAFLQICPDCQGYLALSFAISLAYNLGRTYNWVGSTFSYSRFNVYYIMCYVLIYFLSWTINVKDRLRFEQMIKQRDLLKMFSNLVKVFHDGIIIIQ